MRHGCRRCVVKVKRKVRASRLGPRDPKRPGGVMGDPHGVRSEQEGVEDGMKTASVKSRRDSAEAGHASTSKPASGGHSGYQGPRVEATWGRRVSRFGPQNRGRGPARPGGPKDAWHHRGGCVEAKWSRYPVAAVR